MTTLNKEQTIEYFKGVSPQKFLRDMNRGVQISEEDMLAIYDLLIGMELPFEVINVAMHYVLLSNDMYLHPKQLKDIGIRLKRKDIITAEEAMDFIKQEQKKIEEHKQNTATELNVAKKEIKELKTKINSLEEIIECMKQRINEPKK